MEITPTTGPTWLMPTPGRSGSWLDQVTTRWRTRLDVATFRRLGVSLGVKALGVDDVLVLRTLGRRIGQVRAVLVAYVQLGGVPVVCGANCGSDKARGWFENLRTGGPIEIEYRGRHRTRR